jgi:hypothetical protein
MNDLEAPATWNVDFISALDEDYETDAGYKPKKSKPSKPKTHTVADGENILTVAEAYLPAGMTRKEYAKDLASRNGNWNTGATIQL